MLMTELHRVNPPMLSVILLIALILQGVAGSTQAEGANFEAVQETDRSIVLRVTKDGKQPWYSIPGEVGQLFLSSDGRYAAACETWLDDAFAKGVIVRFYLEGQTRGQLRLKDLIKKTNRLERHGSRLRWGQCLGFVDGSTAFELHTVEAKLISYDVVTGEQRIRDAVWPPISESEASLDLTNEQPTGSQTIVAQPVFSASFPDPCVKPHLFCDRFIEYEAGWKQVRGKWEYRTDKSDGDRLLYQRSALAREGNALMYFDNLNISDADVSTLLQMDLDFPQIAIDDDDGRIRMMRKVSGAGLVFRLRDANNYYMFRLAGEEGAVLGKFVDGIWTDLANPRAIDFLNENLRFRNRWYALRVRMQGNLIQCWITEWIVEGDALSNREQAVISIRDDTFSTGKAGLVTFHAKAQFSHFMVTPIR